jgi:3-dehydroquinate synthase
MNERERDMIRCAVTAAAGRGRHEYGVLVRPGSLEEAGRLVREGCPARNYALISDSQVAELYGERALDALRRDGLAAQLFRFPAGEWNKTREVWAELADRLLRAGLGHEDAVIALGGGVAADLAGFLAATYLGGVPLVLVPTTLVAMLDSAVGGETGLDTPGGKGVIGARHAPAFVLADPSLLSTLPDPQLASGLARAIQYGSALDAGHLEAIAANVERYFAREVEPLAALVTRSLELKVGALSRDEREAGYHKVLDFGRTVGRAVEAVAGYGWLYGEALAAGMAAEAAVGEALGVTQPGVTRRLRAVLEAARLPAEAGEGLDEDRYFKVLELECRRRGSETRYTLLSEVGRVAQGPDGRWTHHVPEGVVREVLFGGGGV